MGLRNRTKTYIGDVYFITTTVVGFTQIFNEDRYARILCDNILHYQIRYQFKIIAYVIVPSHFHWILSIDNSKGRISNIMRDIKKYSAWDLMEVIETDKRNDLLTNFQQAGIPYRNQKRKFWMERFDDEVIRNIEMLKVKINYIHMNPVKSGLVEKPEDYFYSSARDYITGESSALTVDLDWWK